MGGPVERFARAVILHPPARWLEERRQTGADCWDEVWEGVLHIVPPPTSWHQRFGTKLAIALAPLAESKGLEASYETGLYRPGTGENDYRVPDLVFAHSEHISPGGVEGVAELVVELLSDDDESRAKLSFYAEVGVREVLLIDPDTRDLELYSLRGDRFFAVQPDDRGRLRSTSLGVSFAKIEGPRLALTWADGAAEILKASHDSGLHGSLHASALSARIGGVSTALVVDMREPEEHAR
ncbi:MAG: Uma2 family endonuclease [Myxococcales bacterium]